MEFPIADKTYFDENRRLFSDRRISIPRDRLTAGLALDTTLAYRLAAEYFNALERAGGPIAKVEVGPRGIEVRTRGMGVALRFGAGEPQITKTRAAICWPIEGGRMLDLSAESGGTFTVGAEWDEPRQNLMVFTLVEGYPSAIAGAKASPLRHLVYRLTQRPAHVFYTDRFLQEAARELTEEKH